MLYDAIILAGGENSGDLKKIAPYDNEALIIIGNYPMIYYVYKSLRQCMRVNKIVISGPVEALRNLLGREENLFFISPGEDVVESLANAAKILEDQGTSERLLIMPTDIPFITSEAIDDLIDRKEIFKQTFLPVTSREVNEAKYPGVVRTYVKMREGTFTGGNLFIVREAVIQQSIDLARAIIARRKNPLAIARIFGFSMMLKYLCGRLTFKQAEKRFQEVLGIKGKAIVSGYAEVGVDVDKPSDLELAQKYMGEMIFSLIDTFHLVLLSAP